MTYFITGCSGFVGRFLVKYLLAFKQDMHIIGISRKTDMIIQDKRFCLERIDLNNEEQIKSLIFKYRPNYIVHLAAESSVAYSWQYPVQSFSNNVNIFLNLLEAVRKAKIECRILSVGSSEEYGILDMKYLPLKEDSPLNPISPYAVARVSQELLSKVYIQGYGLDIVLTRSFNHFGPYQDVRFAIPSFVRQIIKRKQENSSIPIKTGNLSIIRDFLDVRDVVNAYIELLNKGKKGHIYNVCSGKGYALREIIDCLCDILSFKITTIINPDYLRPNDNPIVIGDNSKIKNEIKWSPKYTIRQTLEDMVLSTQQNI